MSAVYDVRKIVNTDAITLKKGMTGPGHKVKFEDGKVLTMSAGDIVTARYYMEFPKRLGMQITSDLVTVAMYDNGYFTGGVHTAIISHMYKTYINKYLKPNNQLSFDAMENSWKIIFEIINNLYSELQYNVLEYGVSLSWLDYVDLQKDPDLIKAIEDGLKDRRNPTLIENTNKAVADVMTKYPRNNLAKLYNSKAINRIQANQSVGRRGFTADINNNIHTEAVDVNLTRGLSSSYDMICEQPVMAKALDLSEQAIRYSEWLQRELHLSSMSIQSVLLGDCGNRYYHPWIVKDLKELALLEGTSILLDGKEMELDLELHSDLVGKVIDMRRINDCNYLKSGHVCQHCLGAATYTMPRYASVSLTLITIVMAAIGQAMLSAKHFADSMVLKKIMLKGTAEKYLTVDETNFTLKKDRNLKYVYLDHQSYHGYRLLYTNMASKVESLDASKLSSVNSFYVGVDNGSGVSKERIEVRMDGRSGILDRDFIKHSLGNTTLTDSGEYKIDVTNYNGRLFYLENKEFAFDQFSNGFKAMLLGYSKTATVEQAVTEIFNYLNSKLSVNIKVVEILVAAITAEDIPNRDYNIGIDRDTRKVTSYRSVISNRGTGVGLGFERQREILNTPMSYLETTLKPYNPLEAVWDTKNVKWSEVDK